MAFSDGTKRILRLLISRWNEAGASESDPAEHRAFGLPASLLDTAIRRHNVTHGDIRKAIPICPAYPNFGKAALRDLANAERDGKQVVVTERPDGALSWKIEG